MLKYSQANAKTHAMSEVPELAAYLDGKLKIYSLYLLLVYSCSSPKACPSKAVVGEEGRRRIVDGPDNEFRCYSETKKAKYTIV